MPKEFDDCYKRGGKIRTKKLGGGKYMNICYISGHSYPGDVKVSKEGKRIRQNKTAKQKAERDSILKDADNAMKRVLVDLPKKKRK